ncbi:zinc finger protein 558-like [Venturia canescens]|uniref:zinc finger protein 558-like n=1 Tax=Venturia canescens TaxID=32260 RepID=UPI001C9C0CDF|nr:zinc finger protein 558-like [Venturia canescens]
MGTAGRELFERGGGGGGGCGGGGGGGGGGGAVVENRETEQCRICASDVDAEERIDIFAEESRRKYLQSKIRKYLYILVSSEDKLSKMVCPTCAKRLEGVHRFATMAYRTQERLRLRFDEERRPDETGEPPNEIDVDNDGKNKKQHFFENNDDKEVLQKDRGLLHSILTKGGIEIVTDKETTITSADTGSGLSEVDASRDDTQSSTSYMEEMEVRVDPMVFLECDLEGGDSSDYTDESDEEKLKREEASFKINSFDEETDTTLGNHKKVRPIKKNKNTSEGQGKSIESDEDIGNASLKPYECTICVRSFVSQIGLQNHLWSHLPRERRHTGESKPVLRSQHGFSTNGILQANSTDNASSTGNFVCPICSKRISTKGNLKVHLETHRPKGKYGCDICGRIFKTQSNLFRHKEYHGGIQFPCNVCGRVYPTNSTLRAHSITHSDLRPHACPLCDKTFKRNQDLKFHINQHTGARPYQCPYCPKAFASSGNCFSHRKRMHPREVHRDRQRAADLMR